MLFLGLGLAAGFVGAVDGEEALECFPRHFDALVDLLTPIQGGPDELNASSEPTTSGGRSPPCASRCS